jgi:hypothetical protein
MDHKKFAAEINTKTLRAAAAVTVSPRGCRFASVIELPNAAQIAEWRRSNLNICGGLKATVLCSRN